MHELSAASLPELACGESCCLQVLCISCCSVWHACLPACWLADLFCCCLEALWDLLVGLSCPSGVCLHIDGLAMILHKVVVMDTGAAYHQYL